MPSIERFDLRTNTQGLNPLGHIPQHARRIHHDIIRFGEIHCAAIECADLGETLSNMSKALFSADHVRTFLVKR